MKLFNSLKKALFGSEPPAPPTPAPPAPALDPIVHPSVYPDKKIMCASDIHNIRDAFNYLNMRTTNHADAMFILRAMDEIDHEIKDNFIDLRFVPGLVCSDGEYLLQESDDPSGPRFRLDPMNSIQLIHTNITSDLIERFKVKIMNKIRNSFIKMNEKEVMMIYNTYAPFFEFLSADYPDKNKTFANETLDGLIRSIGLAFSDFANQVFKNEFHTIEQELASNVIFSFGATGTYILAKNLKPTKNNFASTLLVEKKMWTQSHTWDQNQYFEQQEEKLKTLDISIATFQTNPLFKMKFYGV